MNRKCSDELLAAQKLTAQIAEALGRGNVECAQRLQASLQRALNRSGTEKRTGSKRQALSKLPSVRERAIAALSELDVPSSPRLIAAYSEARTGEPFDLRAIASIRRDESRSWSSGNLRATYIVPALEAPLFVAGRGRFCLSHWPLWKRVITPLTTRTDHLRVCLHLTDVVSSLPAGAASAGAMRKLLGEYALTISSALRHASKGEGDLEVDTSAVREMARAELRLLESDDQDARQRAAERAQRTLTEQQQLWGAPPPHVVAGT